jgi:hypothetical protein
MPSQVCLNDSRVDLMVSRHTSIWIINQILDFLSEQTVTESEFPVAQLIEHGNVRHSLKEVSLFTTPLLSPNTTARNRMLSLFLGLVDSIYPGGVLGQCVGHYSTI